MTDLELACHLASLADTITMDRFQATDLTVDTKPDFTPVTDADRAVEQTLRAAIAEATGDAVFGEEFGGTALPEGRQWVIDPIDGTKNFVRGVPVWATLIALLVEGNPVLGMVSAPALARRWWATQGGGAFTEFAGAVRPIRVSQVGQLADASLSFSSLSGWKERGNRERFLALTDAVWRVRGFGDFYSYCLVAEGAVDIASEPELSLWDTAALVPIVTEAGGRFSSLSGEDGPHGGNAVATNGLLHEAVLAALR
ncbi:MAG: histidinol-phosphatase [Corynebacterium sp.]|nr:histidinol-phosphatase [Corynebacterium sp.]